MNLSTNQMTNKINLTSLWSVEQVIEQGKGLREKIICSLNSQSLGE